MKNYVPNYHNPLEDYEKQMKEMREKTKEQIEKLNQESIFEEGESPMDYVKRIQGRLNDTIPYLDKIANSSIEQVKSIKLIAENAQKQADSAKIIADKTKIEIEKLTDTSLSAKIKANKSFWLAFLSFAFSVFINLDKIVNIAKWISSCLGLIKG